jgi:hypothetical protein
MGIFLVPLCNAKGICRPKIANTKLAAHCVIIQEQRGKEPKKNLRRAAKK